MQLIVALGLIAKTMSFKSKFPVRLRRAQNRWGFQRGETKLSPVGRQRGAYPVDDI